MEITRQIAALPVRQGDDGLLLVLLVTSREAGRWVIPKGWSWPDREECMSATEEAREEAGVIGRIIPRVSERLLPQASANGWRTGSGGGLSLEVTEESATWFERNERQRCGFVLSEAAAAITDPQLWVLITELRTVALP